MQYVEAFERMGYSVPAPRQDWTAESDTGIVSPSGGLSLAFVTESLGSTRGSMPATIRFGSTSRATERIASRDAIRRVVDPVS